MNSTEPASEADNDAFCVDCLSLMVEDNGCGHLCPVCDVHEDCAGFPCSGEPDTKTPLCPINAPLTVLASPRSGRTFFARNGDLHFESDPAGAPLTDEEKDAAGISRRSDHFLVDGTPNA